ITLMQFIEDSVELYGIIKSSKIFVLPSDREGFGLVTLEANACGLPVLTLDHPNNAATSLILPGENGNLFKGEEALVQLLVQFFADGSKQASSPRFEAYDWNTTVEMVKEAYVT